MTAKTIMICGSMSSAGKSLITTGLCRIFTRKGLKVLPYKSQNMSNNAAVCPTGGEIGRAQAVQAMACGTEPSTDMNPILLKPEADHKSQLIVDGEAWGSIPGSSYYAARPLIWPHVTSALDRLRSNSDLVIIEGAGSIAELNLVKTDIVNLSIARYSDAPILLVGNIDLGGIFAQLIGSVSLLEEEDQKRVRGFIVNKFRGEAALFRDGIDILQHRSGGIPVLGVIPYLTNHGIPDEDAASFSQSEIKSDEKLNICVIRLPHISNFDDFDALKYEPNVDLVFSDQLDEIRQAIALILPGSKNTLGDMQWMVQTGIADLIIEMKNRGIPVVGICGGYQIMGQTIVERRETVSGLKLLPVSTWMNNEKQVVRSRMRVLSNQGVFKEISGAILEGYEIHQGETTCSEPILMRMENSTRDGCLAADGKSFGTYLHGLFDNDCFRNAWLKSLGGKASEMNNNTRKLSAIDTLADFLETHLDIPAIEKIIGE